MAAAFHHGRGSLFTIQGLKGSGKTIASEGVMSWDLRERLMTAVRRKFKASGLG